jgi:glycosyltransferase involved in cell wall biosynthesis
MSSIKISIVIPFYNVEAYISQCLDSVYNQDIPEDEYEVICVNDASPDNSREIVIEYQKKHSNLILIEHEVNRKLGAARNTGRAIAKGKYIWNVDSDDMIKPNILEKLINYCENFDLDILMFNFDHCYENKLKLNNSYPFIDSEVLNGIEFINQFCLNNFSEISPVWSQLYLKKFLDQNGIFSPLINIGEDVPYTLKALLLAKRVKSVLDNCYVYRLNPLSLGGQFSKKVSAIDLYEKCIICSKEVYNLLQFVPKKEKEIYESYLLISKNIISLIFQYKNNLNKDEKIKFRKLIRKKIFNNLYVFKLLNKRNILNYIELILLK